MARSSDDDLDAPQTAHRIETAAPRASGLLGLNRKQMEEERLARQAAKDRPNVHPLVSNSLKRKQHEEASVQPKRQHTEALNVSYAQRSASNTGPQYLTGVVKKTWVFGVPRQPDDIKIEEVLQSATLQLAIMSAFQIDPDWIMPKIRADTKVVWVLHAKTEAEKTDIRSSAEGNYRFCFPPLEGAALCMHSKLMVLSHQTHLRVVVPSANLTSYDWGESGVMENMCFLIDLPRLPEGEKSNLEELPQFGRELFRFMKAMGLEQRIAQSLLKFDFSGTEEVAFVHTIAGANTDWEHTGYPLLSTAVQELGFETDEVIKLDFVASSIGNLNEGTLRSIYLAAKGNNGGQGKPSAVEAKDISDSIRDNLCIYYPSHETVAASRGGVGCGGTICLQSKWYDAEKFPRFLMRDCKSLREGLLMHNKMIFVRHKKVTPEGYIGWAYIGSANLSESAWGKLVKSRGTGEPRLTCRNWECGVVVRVKIPEGAYPGERTSVAIFPGMDIFQRKVPVPMQVPGAEYGEKRPWFGV